ncbi:MAG: hypothetical protein OXC46_05110 [Thaumarchaeota archaeon]|nr:hypothetical protein [Nitrososphaerota archaeon]
MNVEFIEELRLEYERRVRASESLTKKTKDLMRVSGIIAVLIMGFYGLFIKPAEFQIGDWFNLLLISEVLMVITVIMCTRSNNVELQQTILLGSKLTKDSKTDFDVIESWTEATKDDYYKAIIDEYVKSLKNAEDEAERKATRLTMAIHIFRIGLALLPLTLFIELVKTWCVCSCDLAPKSVIMHVTLLTWV